MLNRARSLNPPAPSIERSTPNIHSSAPAPRERSIDLRRAQSRALAEQIVRRADFLPPHDRQLLLAVYSQGNTAVDLARLMRQDPRALRRRIRRLVRRVLSSRFCYVASHKDEWTTSRRRVAIACVLQGCSLRLASKELGLSLHAVRRHFDAVLALCEAAA
jgi:DNA-directed RNA polymerase specialized sigma24 family protein